MSHAACRSRLSRARLLHLSLRSEGGEQGRSGFRHQGSLSFSCSLNQLGRSSTASPSVRPSVSQPHTCVYFVPAWLGACL